MKKINLEKHKEKLDKMKIITSLNGNKWESISEQIKNLRTSTKEEVKECIKPVNNIKNEKGIIL